MANEFKITASIQLRKGTLSVNTLPASYTADQTTANGPTPGMVTATTGGVTVSLAQLTTPGFMQIQNTDATNYVQYGLYISAVFYPLGELLPGEVNVLRLARNILTDNSSAAVLRLEANTASCNVLVQAFDK
jgi:hypothetical protein